MATPLIAFRMDNVHKKFKKGEIHDSLRELLPALTSRIFTSKKQNEIGEREFWALRNISFQVRKGEAFGIIGPNGAGKSTLLKLLCGVLKPTCGDITTNGTLSALIEVGAGFHPDLTGRENIYLNGSILGMKRSEIRRKFDEIVDFSGIGDFIDTPVKRYSSGMYARLGFSVAAHVDPDILIVDEVLSVGDILFQKKCLEKMQCIRRSGASVIFVSHNLRAVAELCDRALLLDRGEITAIGKAPDIVKHYLDRSLARSEVSPANEAWIESVAVRGDLGPTAHFVSGQTATLDITVTARQACRELGVALEVLDSNFNPVFDTSAYRLGGDTVSLQAGQSFRSIFELDLHLGPGVFYVRITLYRYDLEKICDIRFPAASLLITPDRDFLGSTNLYPRVRTIVEESTQGQPDVLKRSNNVLV